MHIAVQYWLFLSAKNNFQRDMRTIDLNLIETVPQGQSRPGNNGSERVIHTSGGSPSEAF